MTDATLGQRIAERRKLLGLSQEGFGEKMGVSRQAISKWEADTSVPEVEKLISMSKLFGVSVGWLLGTEEEEEQLFQIAAAFRMPQPEPVTPPPAPAPPVTEPPAQEPDPEPPAQEPVEIKPPRNWLNIVCVAVAVVSLVLSILSMNRREAPADTSSASGDAKKIAALEEQLTSMEEQIVALEKVSERYLRRQAEIGDDLLAFEADLDAVQKLVEKLGQTETPPADSLPTYNGLTSWSMKAQLADSLNQVTVSFSGIPTEKLKGIQFVAEAGGESVKADCDLLDGTYTAKLNLLPADGYRYLLKLKHMDGTEERITLEGHGLANLTKPSSIAMELVEWEDSMFNDRHSEEAFWIGWQGVFMQAPRLLPEDAQCKWSDLQINHYYNGVPLEQKTLEELLTEVDPNRRMVHFRVTTFNYQLPCLLDGDRHELRMEGTLTVNGVATDFSLPMAEWLVESGTMVRQDI